MKKVLLVTSKNFVYRGSLTGNGYAVTEYVLAADPGVIAEIESLPLFDFVIIEAIAECVEKSPDLYRLLAKKGKVLCLAAAMTEELKCLILDCGISDVLIKSDAEMLLRLLSTIEEVPAGGAGSFLVLDDAGASADVLQNIVTRFNYEAVFVRTADELFDGAINAGTRFMLVNLGARSLDLNGLVRKFYASTAVRGIPVLAYKDMREGIFVHELVSKLNRITRYILGLDELYWHLTDLLFRREIIPLVAQLRKRCDLDANSSFDAETLSQAFFTSEKRLFNGTDLLGDDTLASMAGALGAMGSAIRKVESLKWLKIEIGRREVNTAGRGE